MCCINKIIFYCKSISRNQPTHHIRSCSSSSYLQKMAPKRVFISLLPLNSGFSLILTCNFVLSDEKSICAHAVKFLGTLGILDNQMLLLAPNPLNISCLLRLAISVACRSSFTFFSHVHYFRLLILCNFYHVLSFKVTVT